VGRAGLVLFLHLLRRGKDQAKANKRTKEVKSDSTILNLPIFESLCCKTSNVIPNQTLRITKTLRYSKG
jgi:hypothetical protein